MVCIFQIIACLMFMHNHHCIFSHGTSFLTCRVPHDALFDTISGMEMSHNWIFLFLALNAFVRSELCFIIHYFSSVQVLPVIGCISYAAALLCVMDCEDFQQVHNRCTIPIIRDAAGNIRSACPSFSRNGGIGRTITTKYIWCSFRESEWFRDRPSCDEDVHIICCTDSLCVNNVHAILWESSHIMLGDLKGHWGQLYAQFLFQVKLDGFSFSWLCWRLFGSRRHTYC